MSSVTRGWQITPRDLEMLAALDYAPLTGRQLEKLSDTWAEPFPSARMVRERLQRMAEAKLVKPYNYAVIRSIKPENYYVLTRRGYQLVHGPDSEPPTKGYCSPVALVRQCHQQALSDFIVHTAVGAHRSGAQLTGFRRENTIRLDAGGQSVYPDCSFLLAEKTRRFVFLRRSTPAANACDRTRTPTASSENSAPTTRSKPSSPGLAFACCSSASKTPAIACCTS